MEVIIKKIFAFSNWEGRREKHIFPNKFEDKVKRNIIISKLIKWFSLLLWVKGINIIMKVYDNIWVSHMVNNVVKGWNGKIGSKEVKKRKMVRDEELK